MEPPNFCCSHLGLHADGPVFQASKSISNQGFGHKTGLFESFFSDIWMQSPKPPELHHFFTRGEFLGMCCIIFVTIPL